MRQVVYLVCSAWYDSHCIYGIYQSRELAREALSAFVQNTESVLATVTFKWLDPDTVAEFCEDAQGDQYEIVEIPLNQWTDKLGGW